MSNHLNYRTRSPSRRVQRSSGPPCNQLISLYGNSPERERGAPVREPQTRWRRESVTCRHAHASRGRMANDGHHRGWLGWWVFHVDCFEWFPALNLYRYFLLSFFNARKINCLVFRSKGETISVTMAIICFNMDAQWRVHRYCLRGEEAGGVGRG